MKMNCSPMAVKGTPIKKKVFVSEIQFRPIIRTGNSLTSAQENNKVQKNMCERRQGRTSSHTCKWTGMNLNVIKSHTGQYMTPLNMVGSKSRFNRATISSPLSPEENNRTQWLTYTLIQSSIHSSCNIAW